MRYFGNIYAALLHNPVTWLARSNYALYFGMQCIEAAKAGSVVRVTVLSCLGPVERDQPLQLHGSRNICSRHNIL